MNNTLKIILILINIAMLVIALFWYLDETEFEPLIVFLGQIATLLLLFFEKGVSKIITKNVKNGSDIDIDVKSGDYVKTSGIDKSKIKVKTR